VLTCGELAGAWRAPWPLEELLPDAPLSEEPLPEEPLPEPVEELPAPPEELELEEVPVCAAA
jgi:hypothetical protein